MKPVNTALCSFGMSGLVFHAPFIEANPGYNLYAVWERSKKAAAGIYPRIKSFDSLETMLADDAVELVIVNTPNYTHHEFAKKALLAGKHVLVEKAFTVTVSEAQELVRIADEKNRVLSVFQNRRYDSDFKTVKAVIDEGVLGEVTEAEFQFNRFKPELSTKHHKETALPGAGLLHDLGPHLIDQALYLFGMPQSLFGFIRTTRPHSQVNDYFDITLFYSGLTVRLRAGLLLMQSSPAYIIHGSKGSFIKERADIQEDILKAGQKPGVPGWGIEPQPASGILRILENGVINSRNIESLSGDYMEFYNGLYHSLRSGKNPPVSAEDGLNVMRVIETVLRSDDSKAVISL